MEKQNKSYLSLILWIAGLILIGSIIGSLTKPEIHTWYSTLNRSLLTPPNYVFPIAWSILYAMIASCGWIIWRASLFPGLRLLKILYVIQLLLNWSWTPLFFHYHLVGFSLVVLMLINITVSIIIYLSYKKIRSVSLLMIPYLLWGLFANYLHFYIYQHY
jgi:benzodiazapine receptor